MNNPANAHFTLWMSTIIPANPANSIGRWVNTITCSPCWSIASFIFSIILFERSELTCTNGSSRTRHWESLVLRCFATASLTQRVSNSFSPEDASLNSSDMSSRPRSPIECRGRARRGCLGLSEGMEGMGYCDLCGEYAEDLYVVAGEFGKVLLVCGACSDACTGKRKGGERKRR